MSYTITGGKALNLSTMEIISNQQIIRKENSKTIFQTKDSSVMEANRGFSIIGLGEDIYIVEFLKEENMSRASHNGPWFIDGFFL